MLSTVVLNDNGDNVMGKSCLNFTSILGKLEELRMNKDASEYLTNSEYLFSFVAPGNLLSLLLIKIS
jgi:hypothetical protein